MQDNKQWLELQAAYYLAKDNLFCQYLLEEIVGKKEYLISRLATANAWEEVLKLQGGLDCVNQLLSVVEKIKSYNQPMEQI